MISALKFRIENGKNFSFSAIARSVMISAFLSSKFLVANVCFSAIARSVMISATVSGTNVQNQTLCFSAIARSVMISALSTLTSFGTTH